MVMCTEISFNSRFDNNLMLPHGLLKKKKIVTFISHSAMYNIAQSPKFASYTYWVL